VTEGTKEKGGRQGERKNQPEFDAAPKKKSWFSGRGGERGTKRGKNQVRRERKGEGTFCCKQNKNGKNGWLGGDGGIWVKDGGGGAEEAHTEIQRTDGQTTKRTGISRKD